MVAQIPAQTDVLVVGAGPAGSAAATWAARHGLTTLLVDSAVFPRDKTCGDGLTPRAIHELNLLGETNWIREHHVTRGLRAHGFGQTLHLDWPEVKGGEIPTWGSAVPRTELDAHLRDSAAKAGAVSVDGVKAVDVIRDGDRVKAVVLERTTPDGKERVEVAVTWLVVADGVRSTVGKVLGREWHRDTVYGVAGRSYVSSTRADDPYISSHLELRDGEGTLLSGYGWIFPLGNGEVNLGAGALATLKRPADIAVKPLVQTYFEQCRDEYELTSAPRAVASALLPMGGAVSNVAGANWALIGDAAACVNPLNGEGIDYGLETGREIAQVLADATAATRLDVVWPATLAGLYGEAFSIARRLGGIATNPKVVAALGPLGMRSEFLMQLALRWMGNLVTDADRDAAAKIWRFLGRRSVGLDARPPFS
ncbi:geranylgeranyl reductase family protein [Nocardioides yefusunii]|uniref:Geranylgeranyl reductase family protein n=1 Tax=Nocardioides yefusunii TaxID=2500546 RepID=A0ABW1R1V5_9ACTN|nr:geranylgeranyl reductase family protein [Nocardioides yefusunii]